MELITTSLHNATNIPNSGVWAMGTFDGMHIGHQNIVNAVIAKAQQLQSTAAIMLFEPQKEHSHNAIDTHSKALLSFAATAEILQNLGVDYLVKIQHDAHWANLSAQEFLHLFCAKTQAHHIIMSSKQCLGRELIEDCSPIQHILDGYSTDISCIERIALKNQEVSTESIKSLLSSGCINNAQQMLGRPFSIPGSIEQGNILTLDKNYFLPMDGIYLTTLQPSTKDIFFALLELAQGQGIIQKLQPAEQLNNCTVKVSFHDLIRPQRLIQDSTILNAQKHMDMRAFEYLVRNFDHSQVRDERL